MQITSYLRSSKIIASLSFFELFIWTRGLCFHSCPTLSSSPTYEHMRWPRKVSNKLQTSVKFSKNPSGKTLQNCFINKSSPRSGHWNEQNSYYSPPLVGKSHEEDTITTHFDWKKQKRILLVDRWEDQTATEDTTATLHVLANFGHSWSSETLVVTRHSLSRWTSPKKQWEWFPWQLVFQLVFYPF